MTRNLSGWLDWPALELLSQPLSRKLLLTTITSYAHHDGSDGQCRYSPLAELGTAVSAFELGNSNKTVKTADISS
ncbi:MAG TPA: hypothetical protein VN285_01125 [Candidatus Deferrimicrobium sp.]|nr:hypothetical protein [Candidatus Deferrimicrobium sp.]